MNPAPHFPAQVIFLEVYEREASRQMLNYPVQSGLYAYFKVVTNTTGVIVSMINNQYGFIKFGASEKALFCAKSLFKDGWQFSGDWAGGSAEKHSCYAVLVWCGRRRPRLPVTTSPRLVWRRPTGRRTMRRTRSRRRSRRWPATQATESEPAPAHLDR